MKRYLITAAVLAAVGAVLGLIVAASGIMTITASAGHFAITERFLIFAKQRSVATHTLGTPAPPLGEPSAVLKGAGHFESACRPCHGAPDLPRQPRVARGMLPPPPNLSERAPSWQPEELFYIVKHGIKMTGMPAWPSLVRDDEVSAMVAFLAVLPGLDAAGYRQLVHGPAAQPAPAEPGDEASDEATPGEARPSGEPLGALVGSADEPGQASPGEARPSGEPLGALVGSAHPPRSITETCGRCHGLDGRGRGNAAFPALAGQTSSYLLTALEAYATDRRQSGMMQPLAAALGPQEWRQIADYYSRLPRRRGEANDSTEGKAGVRGGVGGGGANGGGANGGGAKGGGANGAGAPDEAAVERGRLIAERGAPERRLPSCSDCHGPGPGPHKPDIPTLAGQYAGYIELQLQLFAAGHRGGGNHAHLMDEVAPRMSREQMHDVAAYYASLP
jgi:cytochrome c553